MAFLKFKFGADTTGFQEGVNKMKKQTKSFSKNLKFAAGGAVAGVTAVALAFRSLSNKISEVDKTAKFLGRTFEETFKLDAIARENNTTLDSISDALLQVEEKLGDASAGSAAFTETFNALGITQEEWRKADMVGQLKMLSNGFALAEKSGQGVFRMQEAVGDQFKELMPLLSQGGDEIARRFEQINGVTQSQADQIKKLTKLWEEFKTTAVSAAAAVVKKTMEAGAGYAHMYEVAKIKLTTHPDSIQREERMKAANAALLGAKSKIEGNGGDDNANRRKTNATPQPKAEPKDPWYMQRNKSGQVVSGVSASERYEQKRLMQVRKQFEARRAAIQKAQEKRRVAAATAAEARGEKVDAIRGAMSDSQARTDKIKNQTVSGEVISSSLRSVGGGGSAVVTKDPKEQIMRKQVALQQEAVKIATLQLELAKIRGGVEY